MLINLFMPEVFAGGERQCLRLSLALRDHGVAPVILTSRSHKGTAPFDTMDGIPVHRLWSPVEPQKGGRHLAASFAWMRKVARWIEAHRVEIDLIHCHHAKLNAWIGVRAAGRLGVPCVVKIGSAGPNFDFLSLEKKRFLYGRLAARDVRTRTDAFIGTSAEMMRDLAAYGIEAGRRHHIPNGAVLPSGQPNPVEVARLREATGLRPGERLILFAGRMERQKNVETLLAAFATLVAGGAKARLLLLGDGTRLPALRQAAEDLGLGDRAHFAGRVDDVSTGLAAADIFVLPARAEGMSNAVLEAMAHGVPQVVSDVSGNTDLVRAGRTGWLYGPPGDADALARVLAEALATPETHLAALAAASHARVAEGFSIDQVARSHAALYRSLLPGDKAHAHASAA
jgi:glycosyltransferase involved in cell wall biosynthesis